VDVPARLTFRTLLLVSAFTAVSLPAAETTPARLYEVITETGMPHLEENLRYAVTRERRCLTGEDLASAFPVMKSASLADCRLRRESRRRESVSYRLVCNGGHGTTGSASWRVGERLMVGTLNVQLGGKNMTFFQRVTAKPLGQCHSKFNQLSVQ
jgi:hypothetical protein